MGGGPVIADVFGVLLQFAPHVPVERLEEEDALEQTGHVEPERIASCEVREFVREEPALLFFVEIGEHSLGHADLRKTERNRTRDRACGRERDGVVEADVGAHRAEQRVEAALGDLTARHEAPREHEATREVREREEECHRAPREHEVVGEGAGCVGVGCTRTRHRGSSGRVRRVDVGHADNGLVRLGSALLLRVHAGRGPRRDHGRCQLQRRFRGRPLERERADRTQIRGLLDGGRDECARERELPREVSHSGVGCAQLDEECHRADQQRAVDGVGREPGRDAGTEGRGHEVFLRLVAAPSSMVRIRFRSPGLTSCSASR